MKGDFSRDTFDKAKHYAGVLMQQGRVQTDADWNEQWAIDEHRETTTSYDVIGACGAPVHDAGFAITTDGKSLTIGAGRYYADGILVENEASVAYEAQPDLPDAPGIAELLEKAKTALGIVYLDVWHRHITALDDPLIREVALGGPDTTTRAKVVWQVRVLPVEGRTEDSDNCAELRAARNNIEETIKRLQEAGASPDRIAAAQKKLDEVNRQLAAECGGASCDSVFKEWDALTGARDAKLNARTVPPTEDDNPCLLPPSAGYQRLENQLYRVEIHRGGNFKAGEKNVTFKASRDNGTVVTLIEKMSGQEITVRDVGPDDVLGFANGQWVEVIDDALELNGLPGELIQIDDVNAGTRVVTLKGAPAMSFDAERHPKLRRWDTAGEVALSEDWIALEGGIQIQFGAGEYRTGDYWQIPARTATGEIEWAPFEIPNAAPVAQPPRGIRHHYCRLAIVQAQRERLVVSEDCRNLFPPLTEVGGGQAVAAAVHVTSTNWLNDAPFDLGQFFQEGLVVRLDALPFAGSPDQANVIVTMELTPQADTTPTGVFSPLVVLDGEIVNVFGEDRNVIIWRPGPVLRERLASLLQNGIARVRVRLQGHTIWSDQGATRRYLDGQAFGFPVSVEGARKGRIGLQFPSGNGVRASDFESWFYIGNVNAPPTPLQVTSVSFLTLSGAPSSAGTVQLPPIPTNTVFKPSEGVNILEIKFNRPVRREGIDAGDPAVPSSVRVEILGGRLVRLFPGEVTLRDLQTVQFRARDPQIFPEGGYRLVVLGEDRDNVPAVRAENDGSILDGNYDGAAGQDFVLPFLSR
jgi:hypothetical protein